MQWGFCVSAVVRKHKLNVHLLRGWRGGKCVCVWFGFSLVWYLLLWSGFETTSSCHEHVWCHTRTWLTGSRHTHTQLWYNLIWRLHAKKVSFRQTVPSRQDKCVCHMCDSANAKLDTRMEAKRGCWEYRERIVRCVWYTDTVGYKRRCNTWPTNDTRERGVLTVALYHFSFSEERDGEPGMLVQYLEMEQMWFS